jgi:DNA-binding transcriptional LysR family regulator
MLDLNDFYYFVQVVDRGGITAASKSLSMPKSTVSHRIQQLEAGLGVRLINRTSRQFSITDVGQEFYKRAVLMLSQAQEAESIVKQRLMEPSGTIRLTTAVATAQFATGKVIPQFLNRYPKVSIYQHISDASIDIIAENFDIAIRAHSSPLPDSNLIQRTLGGAPWRLFAGARYVEKFGTPARLEDLSAHRSLFVMRSGVATVWRLRSPEGTEHMIRLEPRLVSDDMVGLKSAAVEGLGIVALPAYICREEVASGELEPVLPGWSAGESTLTGLMSVRQGMLPSVRVFMDYLIQEIPKVIAI